MNVTASLFKPKYKIKAKYSLVQMDLQGMVKMEFTNNFKQSKMNIDLLNIDSLQIKVLKNKDYSSYV